MRAERAGQPVWVVPVEKVVPVAKLRIVGVRGQRQRRAARPSPDAACCQPDHVARIFLPRDADGFALHELPEPRDVLLKLPIDDVGTVEAEIAQSRVSMIGIVEGGQDPVSINLRRHDRRRWHDPVVIRVPEDELAGGNAFAADSGDRRLRDAVVKAERLVIAVGPVSALHRAGEFDDASCRLCEQRALCLAGAFERSRRDRMNDHDGMNRRLRGAAQFPVARIALFRVAENFRSVLARNPFLEFDGERAEHAGWQPEGREAVGRKRDVARQRRLHLLAVRVVGHALAEVIAGAISPSHRRACPAS